MQEDKIYGLIAQAEDIQAHAVKLQASAENALQRLPEAARRTFEEVGRETVTKTAQKASEVLLEASTIAIEASATLRSTGLLQGAFLIAVAILISGASMLILKFSLANRLEELSELRQEIISEKSMLEELQGKTWRLELIKYPDGGRGIRLPKGVKFSHAGQEKETGRIVLLLD